MAMAMDAGSGNSGVSCTISGDMQIAGSYDLTASGAAVWTCRTRALSFYHLVDADLYAGQAYQ